MTRKEAIEIIRSIDKAYRTFSKEEYKALEMAIQVLEQTRWIPVNERLPEEYKRVIVSDVFGVYIGEFVDAEENWGGKHFINEHGMQSKSVMAWMLLPQSYKTENEE